MACVDNCLKKLGFKSEYKNSMVAEGVVGHRRLLSTIGEKRKCLYAEGDDL